MNTLPPINTVIYEPVTSHNRRTHPKISQKEMWRLMKLLMNRLSDEEIDQMSDDEKPAKISIEVYNSMRDEATIVIQSRQ